MQNKLIKTNSKWICKRNSKTYTITSDVSVPLECEIGAETLFLKDGLLLENSSHFIIVIKEELLKNFVPYNETSKLLFCKD